MGKTFPLDSYGIFMTLREGMNFEKELKNVKVKSGSFSRSKGYFEFPSGIYSVGPLLGKGSFGETLQAVHTVHNTVCAVKILNMGKTRNRHEFLVNTVKESIINILLEDASKKEPTGPYVPQLYELSIDPARNLLLIRQERLHGTLADLYNGSTKEQNNITVPETLGDLANILHFFYKELAFNHRDLKSDNVMYTFASNKPLVKLIDFGFSCLTWNGVQISGTNYFPLETKCFVPSRDLTQFVYEIWYSFRDRFSKNIQKLLEELLTFPTGTRMCKLFQGCKHRGVEVQGWGGRLYDFLNLEDVQNPQGVPSTMYRRMSEYLGRGSPKKLTPLPPVKRSKTEKIKQCLPEQILNPKTRRCVKRSGKVGRKLMLQTDQRSPSPFTFFPNPRKVKVSPCPSWKTRNPRTNRCRYRCSPDQIRDPKTQRCYSRRGVIGRRVLAEGAKTTPRSFIK